MQLKDKHGVQWLQFDSLSSHIHLVHGFTTRNGGVSHPPFSSLNMGRSTADDPENIEENYRRILTALNIEDRPRYMTKQVHSDVVYFVGDSENTIDSEADSFTKDNFVSNVDGLVTDRTDVVLMTYYADCVPLFIYDPVNHVGGVVHSGWKGTSKQIGKRAVERLTAAFGTKPEDIIAGIGPCAGKCCYEIDEVVTDAFNWMGSDLDQFLTPTEKDRALIDLKGINRMILESAGVKTEAIEVSEYCTMCNNDLLFSYRKEKPKQGLMSAIFALKEKK